MVREARPERQMVRVVRDVTSRLSRFVSSINPVDTGAMRDAWTWTTVGLGGVVGISPASYNPRTGHPVTDYAWVVDDRVDLVNRAIHEGERIAIEALEAVTWEPR